MVYGTIFKLDRWVCTLQVELKCLILVLNTAAPYEVIIIIIISLIPLFLVGFMSFHFLSLNLFFATIFTFSTVVEALMVRTMQF